MAYVTCPWCLTPQLVGDDVGGYQCYTCYGEIRFFACPECGFRQTVSKKWTAFACGRCEAKVELPRRWGYSVTATAREIQGAGGSWPKL